MCIRDRITKSYNKCHFCRYMNDLHTNVINVMEHLYIFKFSLKKTYRNVLHYTELQVSDGGDKVCVIVLCVCLCWYCLFVKANDSSALFTVQTAIHHKGRLLICNIIAVRFLPLR